MRKFIFTTIFILLVSIHGYSQTNEGAQANSELTSVTYVELNNDIISSSNMSLGYIGEFTIFNTTLAYQWEGGNHNNSIFYSYTPSFKYTKVGYNYGRVKLLKNGWERMNNYSITISMSGYDNSNALSISPYFNQMYEKGKVKFGYTFFINDYSWDDFELGGTFYDAAVNQNYSLMIIGMKEFYFKRFVLRPEVFLLSDVRTHYFTLYEDAVNLIDIWYWNDFNMNLYYGSSVEYKITDKFQFGLKLRSALDYDVSDILLGYNKAIPYFITLGANYDF